jgi:hypothetical protein
VVRAEDGVPIPGASVRLLAGANTDELLGSLCEPRPRGTPARSNGQGRFALVVPPKTRFLEVEAEGWAQSVFPVTPGQSSGRLELATGGSLAGEVVDATGDDVAGLRVVLFRFEHGAGGLALCERSTTTDSSGGFSFSGVDARPGPAYVVLVLAADGRSGAVDRVAVDGPRVRVLLGPTGSLGGRVDDALGPVPDARVLLIGDAGVLETRSDAEGRYAFARVAAGRWRARVSRGGEVTEVQLKVMKGLRLTQDLRLGGAGVLSGQVRGNAPLAGVRVSLTRPGREECVAESVTDAAGRFIFRGLPHGAVRIRCVASGFADWASEVELTSASPVLDVVLAPEAVLLGSARDSRGEALAGVVLRAASRTATTAADGAFELRGLAPGEVEVTAAGDGLVTLRWAGTLAPGEQRELRLELLRSAAVSGRLVDPQGQPLTGIVELVVDGAPPTRFVADSDAAGAFAFPSAPPGRAVLIGHATAGHKVTRELVLAEGERAEERLVAR